MLKKQFDYTSAFFLDEDSIDLEEVRQADIVSILGHHNLGIYHSLSCRWKNFLTIDQPPEYSLRSSKELKLLEKSKQLLQDEGYTFEIREMNVADFDEFKSVYYKTTMKKTRAIESDLDERILGRILVKSPVYCSGIYKDNQLVSGALFLLSGNEASIPFSAKERFTKIPGGIGAIIEWEGFKFCKQRGAISVDQGKSHNPAGITTTAGLFEFKARYGYTAYPEGQWVTTYLKNPSITLSDMIFVSIIGGEIGYLVVSDKPIEEILHKYITREVRNISVVSFEEMTNNFVNFFKNY